MLIFECVHNQRSERIQDTQGRLPAFALVKTSISLTPGSPEVKTLISLSTTGINRVVSLVSSLLAVSGVSHRFQTANY